MTITREEHHTVVDGDVHEARSKSCPGYEYPWPFSVDVDALPDRPADPARRPDQALSAALFVDGLALPS